MLSIIDANRCSDVAHRSCDGAIRFIEWIFFGTGSLAVGGTTLRKEYKKVNAFLEVIAELDRGGKVVTVDDESVDEESEWVRGHDETKSDDPHIIGLARVCKARLLYTHDKLLIDDFKNRALINSPRGKIYKNEKQANLLK